MSRKRTQRREKESELARQLGVKTSDLNADARALVAKGRVGHIGARPLRVAVTRDQSGLLAKLKRPTLHLSLGAFLIDGHGTHLVAQSGWSCPLPAAQAEAPVDAWSRLKEDVRYERPARFVLIAAASLLEAPSFGSVSDVESLSLVDGSTEFPLSDRALLDSRWQSPQAVRLVGASPAFEAVSAVCLGGVHKHHAPSTFVLAAEKFEVTFEVDLRL